MLEKIGNFLDWEEDNAPIALYLYLRLVLIPVTFVALFGMAVTLFPFALIRWGVKRIVLRWKKR